MLGKFIIPAKRLGELGEILDGMEIEDVIPLSVLGSSEEKITGFIDNFSGDIKAISDFKEKYGSKVSIDAFEVRLPGELFETDVNDGMLDLMINITTELENTLGKSIPVFYEVTLSSESKLKLSAQLRLLQALIKAAVIN